MGGEKECLHGEGSPLLNPTVKTVREKKSRITSSGVVEHRVSVIRLCCSQAFMFSYGLWISSYAAITLPTESRRFFPEKHDLALAGFLAICGITQLVGPAFGYLSDRTVSRLGKRRPYLIVSSLIALPSIFLQFYARQSPNLESSKIVYFVSFTVSMFALNVLYTAASGIIPDMVPEEQTGQVKEEEGEEEISEGLTERGIQNEKPKSSSSSSSSSTDQANGILAALQALGASCGFIYTFAHPNVGSLYILYAALLFVCIPITLIAIRDDSSSGELTMQEEKESRAHFWKGLWSCYFLDRKKYPDFFWVFVMRTMYYSGMSIQVFLQDMLRDIVVTSSGRRLSGDEPARYIAYLAFIGQASGVFSVYPAAIISDRVGRKPVIATSCVGLCLVFFILMFVHELKYVLMIGGLFGIMNGAYAGVDYALAMDCLPSREDAAKSLAIWGVAAFIGSCMGPCVAGPILYHFGSVNEYGQQHNSVVGYRVILLIACGWLALSLTSLPLIRKAR